MSHPPCMRKPQGDPPKRVTSLALIPRRQPALRRHAHPFFPAYASYLRIASRGDVARGSRRRVIRYRARDCQNFFVATRAEESKMHRDENRVRETASSTTTTTTTWTRRRRATPTDGKRDVKSRARAHAREPHSSVASVGLMARVLPPLLCAHAHVVIRACTLPLLPPANFT